jgi:hypothetical protein
MNCENNKKKFLVIWHYSANYGHATIEAENEQQARELVWGDNKDIEYFVCPENTIKHFPKGRANGKTIKAVVE